MDVAEDRGRFSDLAGRTGYSLSLNTGWLLNADEAIKIANEVGYPVLVRPSYVLGGQGMVIVINDEDLENAVIKLTRRFTGQPRVDRPLPRSRRRSRKRLYFRRQRMCT